MNGQSVMAIGTPLGLFNTPADLREQLTVFESLRQPASLFWLAHPRLASQRDALKATLLGLNKASAVVAAFFDTTGYQALHEVSAANLALADRYMPRLREGQSAVR